MKKILLLCTTIAFLVGCKANYPVEQQSGVEDMAYLVFISGDVYKNKIVDVTIDGKTNFQAKVVKAKKANRRGTQYGVSIGTKNLTVKYQGKTLYNKQIFLSNQETKKIILQ